MKLTLDLPDDEAAALALLLRALSPPTIQSLGLTVPQTDKALSGVVRLGHALVQPACDEPAPVNLKASTALVHRAMSQPTLWAVRARGGAEFGGWIALNTQAELERHLQALRENPTLWELRQFRALLDDGQERGNG
jgi:hypothetical protein